MMLQIRFWLGPCSKPNWGSD